MAAAAAYVPYILAAAGTAAQISASDKQAADKRSILNRQMQGTEQATNKAVDLAQMEGQRFDPNARAQSLTDQENKSYEQTQADIQGAGGAQVQTAGGSGNVSDDFLTTKAQRAVDEGTRLTSLAREAAKTRAPGMLNMQDSSSRANLASNLQNLWSTNNNLARANSMDADSVQEPGYGTLGKIASSIGGGLASGQSAKLLGSMGKVASGINFVPMQPGGGY